MQYFYKEYYNIRGSKLRSEKANERYNYDSTIRTGLKIKPIDQPDIFALYYVPTNKTIDLISQISRLDMILEYTYNDLPGLAQRNFFVDMLSMELQSTNELEGVKSSKEEIVKTTREIMKIDNKNRNIEARFKNVIKSYLELKEGKLKPPKDPKDCRKIYDEITSDGISKEDYPDGRYFRKGATYIYKDFQEIHRGVTDGEDTEQVILERVNELLKFMYDLNISLHSLIKIAIGHYYFGYIHPFYDGNGRTGRFISSMFLKEEYSWLTAMSLSQGCNQERDRYLKIFHRTNQISSQGEMNYFIDEFLSIIIEGQKEILENLINKNDLLRKIIDKIDNDESLTNEDEKNIMSIVAQEYHFNSIKNGVGVEELQPILGYQPPTIRQKLRKLHDMGLIEKVKGRPVKYVISKDYLEN